MMRNKKLFYGILAIVVLGIVGVGLFTYQKSVSPQKISSFEECVKAGYPVMESYPRQCKTPDGRNFVEKITEPLAIVLESIVPTEGYVGSTIFIIGRGFTLNNDIGFTYPGGSRFIAGYINGIASPDGKSLRVTIPEGLGACALSQMKENEVCPTILLSLPKGETEIFVANQNGESNKVKFEILER